MTARARLLVLGMGTALLLLAGGCGGQDAPAQASEARRTVFLSQVLFVSSANSPVPPNLMRRRAEQALDLIRRGESFESVARTQSQDLRSREGGGFLGVWEGSRPGMETIDGAVQVLEEGEVAGPVLSREGWHVLKRHAYEEGRRLERERYVAVWGIGISHRELRDGFDRSKDEARTLAAQLVADLRAGRTTLEEAKARYAPAFPGRKDGWMGLLDRRPETALLFDQLQRTPVGEYIEPLDLAEGFSVVKRGPQLRAVVRHILVQHLGAEDVALDIQRLEPEAEARARQALTLAQADRSAWDSLVVRFSDELATAKDSGSLGCVGPNELDPALETAVLATPPGEFHREVVKTPRGYHVVWRVD